MFYSHHRHHKAGFIFLTLASIAMTVPFLGYMKRIVNSLEKISEKKYL